MAQPVDLSPQALIEANSLERPGAQDFHIVASFDLLDMSGSPFDSGTLEYWWAGAEGTYLTVISPRLGTVHFLDSKDDQSPEAVRELWLLRRLLEEVRDPAAALKGKQVRLESTRQTVSTRPFVCLHAQPQTGDWHLGESLEECFDGATGTLRTETAPGVEVLRNRPARFAGTNICLEMRLSISGFEAASFSIKSMQSFQVAGTEVPLRKPPVHSPEETGSNSGIVKAAKKISGQAPVYPLTAKASGKRGLVLLYARITKAGGIDQIVPIASPDPRLTQSAIDAVKTWRYHPAELNGAPVDLTTTMSVGFYMPDGNSGR